MIAKYGNGHQAGATPRRGQGGGKERMMRGTRVKNDVEVAVPRCRGGFEGARSGGRAMCGRVMHGGNEVEQRTVCIRGLVKGADHRHAGAADAPGKEVVKLAPDVAGELEQGWQYLRPQIGHNVGFQAPISSQSAWATRTPRPPAHG